MNINWKAYKQVLPDGISISFDVVDANGEVICAMFTQCGDACVSYDGIIPL